MVQTAPGTVDVIVPVYGAAPELRRCLASLARHTDWATHRLVLVVDGPQAAEVEEAVSEGTSAIGEAPVTILRNEERRGFVRSVNRGMAASDHDVVLLNSDTEVTAGWLAKLQAAAWSSPSVATVTPFSNDATLVSVPRGFARNAIPAGHDVDSFAALVERVSIRDYPPLPTGVGLCLYIKRKALDALGPFDEERFGLGYGEENDFCVRAVKAGYLNVLDDATFVYHAGQGSFGASRARRVRRAERLLARMHPDYLPSIARFMREDPLRAVRGRILEALTARGVQRSGALRPRVLHVVQGWPPFNHGGTEVYARGLAVRQAQSRPVAVHARLEDKGRRLGDVMHFLDHGAEVRLVVNNFTQRNPLSRNSLHNAVMERDLERLLEEAAPDLVHVHHLAGHSLALPRRLAARQVPYVLQLQDWWLPCARTMLLLPDRSLCSGPGVGKCARCLPLTGLAPAGLWSRLLHRRRRRLAREVVRRAAALVAGSRFAAESVTGFLGTQNRVQVLPYGVETASERSRHPRGAPLRFGVLGAVMPHKGAHVAVAAFRGIDPARAVLEVWGDPAAMPAYARELREAASPAVTFCGAVPEAAKAERLSALDVLIVPSLGLESFGIAAREAMARGVPVLASRRGALAEAFVEGECGAFFEPGDAAALRGWIDKLCADPGIVSEWSSRLPAVKTMDAHAEEIEAVYETVMAGGRPR